MNAEIKDIIINNEKTLLLNFPEYSSSIKQFIYKLTTIQYDKHLYEFVKSSFVIPRKVEQERQYNLKGFKSAPQLIEEYIDLLDFNNALTEETLEINNSYSSMDICGFARNYNNQVGMYYNKNKRHVIIKSTVEDNDRPYDDRWIKEDIVLKYFMQKEKEVNLNSLVFSNRPNAMIFNALMDNTCIDVHVFVNKKKGDSYIYKGVFHPCGIVNQNKAFILYLHGNEQYIPFENMDDQLLYKLLHTGARIPTSLRLCDLNDISDSVQYPKMKTSKRTTIQQKKIELELALRGEQLVLEYEERNLKEAGRRDLVDKVENVSLYDDTNGYDISSYHVCEDGSTKEVRIKVICSATNTGKTFKLTSREYNNLVREPQKYMLYKVYDVFTDDPKFYTVDLLNSNMHSLSVSEYEVRI